MTDNETKLIEVITELTASINTLSDFIPTDLASKLDDAGKAKFLKVISDIKFTAIKLGALEVKLKIM